MLAAAPPVARAQVVFTESHLPIVVLDTQGKEIPDEPKIMARMGIIDNGPGRVNRVSDAFNGYDGWVGIERRGASSQAVFPKKQYAVETRQADGTNRNVSLLGLPRENDWILHAPYSDKSLMRNVLAYHVARRLGRWASRTRWCEVVLNGSYQGVYLLMEKIKQDPGRVPIADLNPSDVAGDALTGGYILKIDKWSGANNAGWSSRYRPPARSDIELRIQYHDPQPSDLVPAQQQYIRGVLDRFEAVLAGPDFKDPVKGYAPLIDVTSFADFLIVNELGRNVDGYRLSTFFYKDRDSRDGRLAMGPVWDFNLAFGNADYYNGSAIAGWQFNFAVLTDGAHPPFWWQRLVEDEAFRDVLSARWHALRRGPLHTDSLTAFLDAQVAALGDATDRNFRRWPVLSQYVWPNNFVGGSYPREVDYLKQWLRDRTAWIDVHIDRLKPATVEAPELPANGRVEVSAVTPSPTAGAATVQVLLAGGQPVVVAVYDMLGRRRMVLFDDWMQGEERHVYRIAPGALPPGVYFVHVVGIGFVETRGFVVLR